MRQDHAMTSREPLRDTWAEPISSVLQGTVSWPQEIVSVGKEQFEFNLILLHNHRRACSETRGIKTGDHHGRTVTATVRVRWTENGTWNTRAFTCVRRLISIPLQEIALWSRGTRPLPASPSRHCSNCSVSLLAMSHFALHRHQTFHENITAQPAVTCNTKLTTNTDWRGVEPPPLATLSVTWQNLNISPPPALF
jgi:hypothetical protein